MSELEDLIQQATAAGIGAFNLFLNSKADSGYQANVANQRTGSYGICSDDDPVEALKAALRKGISKAKRIKPVKRTADDLL